MDRANTGTFTARDRALKALDALPPFPPTLTRLMGTLLNDTVPLQRVVDIIATDAAIAGNVLKTVNSALYARRRTVDSIQHAVSLLGISKLRNVVFAMSVSGIWKKSPQVSTEFVGRFNLHSVACAVMSDLLAKRLYPAYASGAFAAGLLHDIGAMLIAIAFPEEHERCNRLQSAGSRLHAERSLVGVSHAELSADALACWNLPDALVRAVRYHHAPEADPSPIRPGDVTLSAVLNCADAFVTEAGYGFDGDKGDNDGATEVTHDLVDEFAAEMALISTAFQ